jgi:hypothetical protein
LALSLAGARVRLVLPGAQPTIGWKVGSNSLYRIPTVYRIPTAALGFHPTSDTVEKVRRVPSGVGDHVFARSNLTSLPRERPA